MEKKNKGMFSGFQSVFTFTAQQNIKEKGFLLSTVVMTLVVFGIMLAVSIITANVQKDSAAEADKYEMEDLQGEMEDEDMMENLIIFNQAEVAPELFEGFVALLKEQDMEVAISYTDINPNEDSKKFTEYCTKDFDNSVGLAITIKENELAFDYYLFDENEVSRDVVTSFANSLDSYYTQMKYVSVGFPEEMVSALVMPTWDDVLEAGEDESTVGATLVKVLAPMLFSVVLFYLICMYGQSITKVVMAEKTSKLMEVLLTSVRPQALLAGKIVAMFLVAIMQVFVVVLGGVLGSVIGDVIAKQIYSDYENIIGVILDVIAEDGTGFSVGMFIFAVIFTLVGFLLYCVWAGFIASAVDKVDDISTAVSLFQIPAMVGFFWSYFGTMLEGDIWMKIAEYFPVLSPFVMPADMLVGKASMVEALISFVILVVFTIGMIYAAGKIYKGKLFNRK